MGRVEVHTGFWLGKLRGRVHLENLDVDGRIILRWIFRKYSARWGEKYDQVGTYGKSGGAYRFLVGKTEVKRPLGKPRRRWEDNIKTDIQEVLCSMG